MIENQILQGDALERLKGLPGESVNCCITSPPYWGLRDYGVSGQIGLERTPEEYVGRLVEVFREVRRVIREDGTLWLNLGDSYNAYNGNRGTDSPYGGDRRAKEHHFPTGYGLGAPNLKPKDLCGIPWRVAFALQADGWYLRQDIIWHKPNPMPESVTDRCTKAHEYVFLLAKAERYYYDAEAIKEDASGRSCGNRTYKYDGVPGMETKQGILAVADKEYHTRNRRSVWTIATSPFPEAHFAVFPEELVQPCILAGCPEGGLVLDPFMGSGTVAQVALKAGRRYIGIELNPEYIKIAEARIWNEKHQARLA